MNNKIKMTIVFMLIAIIVASLFVGCTPKEEPSATNEPVSTPAATDNELPIITFGPEQTLAPVTTETPVPTEIVTLAPGATPTKVPDPTPTNAPTTAPTQTVAPSHTPISLPIVIFTDAPKK